MPDLDVVKSYRAIVTISIYELPNNLRPQGAARFPPPQDGENVFADEAHVLKTLLVRYTGLACG